MYTHSIPSTSSTMVTVVSRSLGEGRWLVAGVDVRRSGYNATDFYVNGVQTLGSTAMDSFQNTGVVLTGPVTVTVAVRYVTSGTVYIVKLP